MFLFDVIDWALSGCDISSRDTSPTTILLPNVSWNSHFVEYNASEKKQFMFALLVGCGYLN